MSASYSWRPVKRGRRIPVSTPSAFCEAMSELFSEPPWTLAASDQGKLDGLRAGMKHERDAFAEIEEAITKHGTIVIEVEY